MRARGSVVVFIVLIASFFFASCGKKDNITVGLSFGEFLTERWSVDHALLTDAARSRGVQVVSRVANHDPDLQNRQIESLIEQKVDVLIVVPEDGALCAPAVAAAKRAGVKVIAYDRLVRSKCVDAFLSFDSVEVGRAQALGVLRERDSGDFVLLGGSFTDFNARLLRAGQMEILRPYIDSGKIRIAASEWTENWLPANAFSTMERVLRERNGKVDAVIASNDGTALAAVGALKAWGLCGKVPVSGQDASESGCKAVVAGNLSVTVFKDFRDLAPIAIDFAIRLARNEPIPELQAVKLSELVLDESMEGFVNCRFLPIVPVDRTNVYAEVIRSGFQAYDAVYADITPEMRPPRP